MKEMEHQTSDIDERVEQLIEFITGTPDSPIYKALQQPVPQTDFEYIVMWEEFYKFTIQKHDHFRDLINDWTSPLHKDHNFEVGHKIWHGIQKRLEKSIEEKLEKITFTPRLETYLETLPSDEYVESKKIILFLLAGLDKMPFKDNLATIGELIGLSKKWILSVTKDHQLVEDRILEFVNLSINEDKPFHEKEVIINPVVEKVFLGVHVDETELVMIKDSPLIEMFELADPDLLGGMFTDDNGEDDFEYDSLFSQDFEEGDLDLDHIITDLEKDEREFTRVEKMEEPEHTDDEDDHEDESEVTPYKSDLDYLHQEFLWLAAKFELYKEQNDNYSFSLDNEEKKINNLRQKTTKLKNLCDLRLRKTLKNGFTPRLIALKNKLKLNEFEVNAIKILVTAELFLSTDSFSHSKNSVGEVLTLLFEDEKERVRAKKMFLKKSKLIRSSLLSVESTGYGQNLFGCSIEIDNRLVEYLVGEDYDISNYVEGSNLYGPSVTIADVIMPSDEKSELLLKVDHYPSFVKTKKKVEMPTHIEYGDAQVNLFVGPSGTGKTMLTNALANYLNKKILLFNLNSFSNIDYYGSSDKGLFSLLFREARMNDAILFFDEAEALLSNRINDLLIELEKHHGIVIFATNASFVVDDALNRRINHVVKFKEPGPQQRKKIWENHLPNKIEISDDVDLNKIALRYEINGGLIKNAVFAAVANAVAESESDDIVLRMDHLERGADEQLKNKLFMSKMETQITPRKSFRDLILPEETKKELHKLSNLEKSRKVLVGEWGFNDVYHNLSGMVALFHGPPGTGKTLAAEALAYETGKNLKRVNYAEVMSKWVGETEKALEALMKEVAETDSILLFDEADGLFASRTDISTVNDRYANMITNVLLSLTENFNSIAVLTTNYIKNIDPAFYRRMELVEFTVPDKMLRRDLWKILIPKDMPLAENVDLEKLVDKYPFTGGDIKNAVIAAASAKAWMTEENRTITMNDLTAACEKINRQKNNGGREIGF